MPSMNTLTPVVALAALLALAASGCRHVGYVATDAGEDGGTDTYPDLNLSGIDLLIIIDDSSSMKHEQTILASDLFAFVGALVSPLPTSEYAAIDDLRVAVVTSNMGFSSDGVSNDAYWPYPDVPPSCQGFGDDGRFQTVQISAVEIANDIVACDATAAQCPPGWTCASLDGDGIGVCHTGGDATIGCPSGLDPWVESTPDDPDPNLAARVACLTMQGTDGCGFEQQLASATVALTRDDQVDFVRADALLAVLVVSDEEDCSMQDGQALFGVEEIQNESAMKVNIACGEHQEYLFPPSHFYDQLVAVKQPGAVFFAAIVGVPYGDQAGAAACQGFGDALGSCLDQDEMLLVPEEQTTGWFYQPACTRDEGGVEVTQATPGRRYVMLANESFGSMSYVYSICNADWSAAFRAIGAKTAALLQ
jgi:hypothetical protein